MSEPAWKIKTQTIEDLVTGLRFAFTVYSGGGCRLAITRFDAGVPGVAGRDLVFDKDGEHTGSGSPVADVLYPINPAELLPEDPADWWKRE